MTTEGDLREQRWRKRMYVGVVLTVVVAVGLGALFAALRGDGRVSWLLIVMLAVFALVVAAAVIGVHAWLRRRDPERFGRSPLWDLERPERKEVARAIRRGTDVRPELRDVAARTAHQMSRLGRFLWVYVVVGVLELANGAFLQDGTSRWLSLLLGVLFLAAGAGFAWQVRRARAAEQRFRGA